MLIKKKSENVVKPIKNVNFTLTDNTNQILLLTILNFITWL